VESIKTHGVKQPILLRPSTPPYEIVTGTRRYEACKELGLDTIPAIVEDLDDKTAFEIILTENIQRKQLTPLEEAKAFLEYVAEYKWGSIRELARRINKSPAYIVNRIRLIELPEKVSREMFPSETFTVTHAEELLRLDRPEDMEEVGEAIKHERLTTRETAEVVNLVKDEKLPVERAVKTVRVVEQMRARAQDVAEELKDALTKADPDKAERLTQIATEELRSLSRAVSRLEAFPERSLKMEPKFEQLQIMEERGVIQHTIWDFRYRDDYAGDKDFHGNCSPQIVEQCIWRLTEEGDLVVDPMAGSGTTVDVCRRYNRECIGYDIKPPATRTDIIQNDSRKIPLDTNSVDMVFIHPPYWNLAFFTDASENLPDLSRARSIEVYLSMLKDVFAECYRILKPEKYMCVLQGDLIRDGRFIPLCRGTANLAESLAFVDCGYAVKLAHGEVSRKKSGVIFAELAFTDNLKISHDLVMFFKKGQRR
jgi:ParB/RepB/Spo0J family partition protein